MSNSPVSYFDLPTRGDVLLLPYPRRNRHYFGRDPRRKKPPEILHRLIKVLTVEDGTQIPIPIDAFLRRPTVRRGRWRIIAWDAAKRGERTFYPEHETPCKLQLGLWNPLTGEILERIGETYEQTPEGLLELRGACEEILKEPPPAADQAILALFAA